MKVPQCDWTKYTFDGAYKYLLKCGLRNKPPTMNSPWMKLLIYTQIFGGFGTINDMFSYAGFDPEKIVLSYKYHIVDFLQYYSIIEEVKRQRPGGRVFEITKFGEDLIDWVTKH